MFETETIGSSVTLAAAPPEPGAPCTETSRVTRDLAFSHGLRLGMTPSDVRRVMGGMGETGPRGEVHECRYDVPLTEEERKAAAREGVSLEPEAKRVGRAGVRIGYREGAVASIEVYAFEEF